MSLARAHTHTHNYYLHAYINANHRHDSRHVVFTVLSQRSHAALSRSILQLQASYVSLYLRFLLEDHSLTCAPV